MRLKTPAQLESVAPRDIVRLCRFIEIDRATGCWLWTGFTDPKGYGQFRLQDRAHWAHRVSYVAFVGPLAAGLHVDHVCRNTSCVCPDHLEAVQPTINRIRQAEATAAMASEEESTF